MSELIKAAIAESLGLQPSVTSAWGFGSFFRGERHHDIDVVVVVKVSVNRLVDTARELRAALLNLEYTIGITIDPLILTEAEFESRPLRNMGQLVRIPITGL